MGILLTGALMGLGGTIAMDLWAIVLNKGFNQPLPNWAMPGRWFGNLFRGRVFHDSIGDAQAVSGELSLGWVFHYGVGIIYGIAFLIMAGTDWLAAPSFVPLWIFSLITIAAGWFLLHPGMGLGWAASKTPAPWKTRGLGLVAHTVFAIGMWMTVLALT